MAKAAKPNSDEQGAAENPGNATSETVRVRMAASRRLPEGHFAIGQTYDLPANLARDFLSEGAARKVSRAK